jgi:hypothetical protein
MHTPSAKEVGRNTLVPFCRPCHEDGGRSGSDGPLPPHKAPPLSHRHAEANGSAHSEPSNICPNATLEWGELCRRWCSA